MEQLMSSMGGDHAQVPYGYLVTTSLIMNHTVVTVLEG